MHGATVTMVAGQSVTMKMVVNGIDVEVKLVKLNTTNFGNSSTVHGRDQGPAFNTVKWDAASGKWVAELVVNGSYGSKDLDKMAIHEFNEIADIVVKADANKTGGKYDDGNGGVDSGKLGLDIADQQKASVFTNGVNPTTVDLANMTSHDHAVVKELEAVMRDLQTDLSTAGADSAKNKERVKLLMETMGIKHTDDAGFKLLTDKLGLNIPPDVKAWIDGHVGKDANQQMIMDKFHGHVKVAGFDGTYVKGGHNSDSFQQFIDSGKIQVISSTPGLSSGVTVVDYNPMVNGSPKLDAEGDPIVGKKTTYDPTVWTEARMIESGTDAWNDALANPATAFFVDPITDLEMWRGLDSQGNQITGHYMVVDGKKIPTTFWPD